MLKCVTGLKNKADFYLGVCGISCYERVTDEKVQSNFLSVFGLIFSFRQQKLVIMIVK